MCGIIAPACVDRRGLFWLTFFSTIKMALHFFSNSSLQSIQSGFTKNFPRLKIDFIFQGNEKLNLSSNFHQSFLFIPVETLFPDCAKLNIVIDESMTTNEVEALFESQWHLPAIVYAEVDGYWQRNNKTKNSRLTEFRDPALPFNKEDALVSQN
jgi:hypothetical protein